MIGRFPVKEEESPDFIEHGGKVAQKQGTGKL